MRVTGTSLLQRIRVREWASIGDLRCDPKLGSAEGICRRAPRRGPLSSVPPVVGVGEKVIATFDARFGVWSGVGIVAVRCCVGSGSGAGGWVENWKSSDLGGGCAFCTSVILPRAKGSIVLIHD